MIAEESVSTLCDSLPDDSFIRRYVDYCRRQTTSPLGYQLGSALSLLSLACPENYGMRFAGALRMPIYVLLVGRSGRDRKSTAVNIAHELLAECNAEFIGEEPGSAEGLSESLEARNRQVIFMSEFGKFLSMAQGGYFEKIKTMLTDVWDCKTITRRLAGNRTILIEEPRLTLLAGCSLPYLEKYTLIEDWQGGFMGRWLIFYAHEERHEALPLGDPRGFDWLRKDYSRRLALKTSDIQACVGLDPMAECRYRLWFEQIHKQGNDANSRVAGLRARAPAMALKAALLLAFDENVPIHAKKSWKLNDDHMLFGIKIAKMHMQSVERLTEVIADHPDARMRRAVLECVRQAPSSPVTLGYILQRLQFRKRVIAETLDGLLTEGTLIRVNAASGEAMYAPA